MRKYEPGMPITESMGSMLAMVERREHKSDLLIDELNEIIGKENVFDLSLLSPECILSSPRYRTKDALSFLLVSGDDRSISKVVSALYNLGLLEKFTIGPLPSASSSVFARFLGWTRAHHILENDIRAYIKQLKLADPISVDLWHLNVLCEDDSHPADWSIPATFFAYFCIGQDAERVRQIEETLHDGLSTNHYTEEAYKGVKQLKCYIKELFASTLPSHCDLSKFIEVECDGLSINERLQAIKPDTLLFLNVNGYRGNSHPWGYCREWNTVRYLSKWKRPLANDGYLEVIAYNVRGSIDIRFGGRGHRLSQCQKATVVLKEKTSVCVDGHVQKVSLQPKIRIEISNHAASKLKTLATWSENAVDGNAGSRHLTMLKNSRRWARTWSTSHACTQFQPGDK